MPYDEYLAERIERILIDKKVEFHAKKMMGGLCYMMDDKMLCGIVRDELMARVGPDVYQDALNHDGASEMNFTGRSMKGFVFVQQEALDTYEDLEYWIQLCILYNPLAKRSKKKIKKS